MGFVSAVCGNTAWTCGLTWDDIIPPSGPSNAVSCRTRVTTAKYLGKSVVRMRVIRRWYNSSADSKSTSRHDDRCSFGFLSAKNQKLRDKWSSMQHATNHRKHNSKHAINAKLTISDNLTQKQRIILINQLINQNSLKWPKWWKPLQGPLSEEVTAKFRRELLNVKNMIAKTSESSAGERMYVKFQQMWCAPVDYSRCEVRQCPCKVLFHISLQKQD